MKYDFLIIVFVVVSISLSLFTVISSESLSMQQPLVAKATSTGDAEVSLAISTYLSIFLADGAIDFGSCAINNVTNYSLFDSNKSASWLDNSLCENATFPDYMVIENDGTQVTNITVQINQTGAQLFNDSNAWFAFKVGNNSARPGCLGILQDTYLNFSIASTDYPLCSWLSHMDTQDQINFYMQAYVTNNSSGGGNTTVQFTASAI